MLDRDPYVGSFKMSSATAEWLLWVMRAAADPSVPPVPIVWPVYDALAIRWSRNSMIAN